MKKRMRTIKTIFAALLAFTLCANVATADVIAKDLTLPEMAAGSTIGLMEEVEDGVTVLFENGKADQYFETTDVEWLMKANDDDVFTVVYSCEEAGNLGWGILGWRGTVDGNWVGAWDINADGSDATTKCYSRYSVKAVKESLGITENSKVDKFALGAWNKGKIEGLYLSSADKAPKFDDAKEVIIKGATDEELPPLTGDYLYVFEKPEELEVWYADYLAYLNPGETVYLTVEMESNGNFGGALGTCVNNWAWQMEEFSSDGNNQATVTWFHTPLLNNFKVMMWWVNGTQVGLKSVKIEKAIDYSGGSANQGTSVPSYTVAHSGTINPATDWEGVAVPLADLLGNVDPANVDYIVFSSATSFWMGYNNPEGGWTGYSDMSSYRCTGIDFSNYNLLVGHGADTEIKWEVVERENAGGNTGDGGSTDDGGNTGSNDPVFNGQSVTANANAATVEISVPYANLLGTVNAAAVESITFTSDVNFQIGYGLTADPYWAQTGDGTTHTITVDTSDIQLDAQWYVLKLFLFVNDGNDHTISWTVNERVSSGGSTTPITGSVTYTATGSCAEYSVPLADLLCGVDASNVKSITFTSENVDIQVGYGLTADPYWAQTGDGRTHTIEVDSSDIQLAAEWYALKLMIFVNDGNDYTVGWEIETR